jgi:hypothetical protein
MTHKIFIDTDRSVFVKSKTSNLPAKLPLLKQSSNDTFEFYLLKKSSTPGTLYDYVEFPEGTSIELALGTIDTPAKYGGFKLISDELETEILDADSTSDAVETALNAVLDTRVSVSKIRAQYVITFLEKGAQDEITVSEWLKPAVQVTSEIIKTGDADNAQVQLLRIRQLPLCFVDEFTYVVEDGDTIGVSCILEMDTENLNDYIYGLPLTALTLQLKTLIGIVPTLQFSETVGVVNDLYDGATLDPATLWDYYNKAETNGLLNGRLAIAENLSEIDANGTAAQLTAIDNLSLYGFWSISNNSYIFSNLYYDGTNFRHRANGNAAGLVAKPDGSYEITFSAVAGSAGDTFTPGAIMTIDVTGIDLIGKQIKRIGDGGITFNGSGADDTNRNLNNISARGLSTTLTVGGIYKHTANGITTTLMASPANGDVVTIINYSGGSNTIDGNGSDIRSGSATASASVTIGNNEVFKLIYDGAEWLLTT